MSRFFNIAGPCLPQKHFMIPAGRRCANLWELVDRETYFVIHAARQTGKSTLLLEFVQELNRSLVPFVHSVALVGMRNLRHYKTRSRSDSETLGSVSPFNIITKSLTIRNFTRDEIAELCAQHTDETGQVFPGEVIEAIWKQTCGQPWLVNAIAREIVDEILERDPSRSITPEHVQQARNTLIIRRDTHIDSLMERLREPRVQRIIEPIILGESGEMDALMEDYQYVHDLGLITTVDGVTQPANPMYGEVILRTLNYRTQFRLAEEQRPYALPRYIVGDGLDMRRLLGEFQDFWRENSEIWSEVYVYKESAPHLILLAFLQRVVNHKASLSREFAAGRGRIDVCIHFNDKKYPIEIKVLKGPRTIEKGYEQLAEYMDTLGTSEGWLLVFNRDPKVSWDEKITWSTHRAGEKTIHLVGA